MVQQLILLSKVNVIAVTEKKLISKLSGIHPKPSAHIADRMKMKAKVGSPHR